jgi:hypothetical protein
MDANQHSFEPDFSTLTGIMDYFSKVPFETFKKELDKWFIQEINKKQTADMLHDGHDKIPEGLLKLIDTIYMQADNLEKSH